MVVFAIALPIIIMNLHLFGSFKIFPALSTALLISLPFVFIPPKLRVTSLIPVWAIAIFYLTNLWYWRFFNDFIPLQNYFLFGNFDSDLFGAGAAMVKLKDFALAFPAVALTLLYLFRVFKPARNIKFALPVKVTVAIAAAVCFVTSELYSVVREREDNQESISSLLAERYDATEFTVSPFVEYYSYGLIPYIYRSTARPVFQMFKGRTMSDEERGIVERYIDIHSELASLTPDHSEIFSNNRDKNLIFIIVESLNAWAVDYEYGGERLMPVLSELISADGSISTAKMVSQVHSGVSSDGQFIYNTGLYAASDATTIVRYLDNDLPSLPTALKPRTSFELICEGPTMWSHDKSNRAYGYDKFVYNTDLRAREEGSGRDGMMFKTALAVIDTIPKPFYGLLVTMSMHGPFKDENVDAPKWIADIPGISEQTRNYLTVTNYFDRCLGEFLESLKEKGLYDDSIIAIASDHSAPVDGSGHGAEYVDIVFTAANTGMTLHPDYPVGQVDVYPTLLQVMDVFDPNGYNGMGLSMLNPALCGAIDKFSNIHGESLSPQLDSMLVISGQVANAMLRADKCRMEIDTTP